MFYSTELLSHRRKGKLAKCWLAATVSEKMFKTMCRPNLIQKIDVYHTCEQILLAIEIRDKKNYSRFSLYLSSQLMYGVTKILFYQTKFFQDYLFVTYGKLIKVNRPQKDLGDVPRVLELPNVSDISEVFRNVDNSSNLHLIIEKPYTSIIEHMMQDKMNFGVLTDDEMEKFLFLGEEGKFLNEIRKFHWDELEETAEDSRVQVPLVNLNQFEMETIEIEKETRLSSARRDQRESLIAIEDDQPRKHTSTTSRKRTLKSPEEVPSKKRKVSPETETIPAPIPEPILEQIPEPIPEVTAASTHTTEQQVLSAIEGEQLIKLTKSKSKRKLYDKRTKLSDAVMQTWIRDVKAHTIQHQRFMMHLTTLPSAKEYLTQPSTIIFNRPWGKPLIKFFKKNLVKSFLTENEFQMVDFEIEDTIAGETIRGETSSKLRDQTGELSSKIAITTTETTDQSKMLEKILPANDYQPMEIEEHQRRETKESEELMVELPDITDIEEKMRELSEKLEKSLNEKKSKSSSSSFEMGLIKSEILALMEIQWREKRLINFHEFISPENYNKREAAYVFNLCLEFQAKKVVILKQADPYSTIWIEKYPCYSLETDAETVVI